MKGVNVISLPSLFLLQNLHFIHQMFGSCQLVNHKQCIADVERDVTTDFGIVNHIAHGAFPYTVEVHTNQVAFGIEHRRTGVTATGMVGSDESYRHGTVHFPTTVILRSIEVSQALRNVVVIDFRIILLDDTFQ